MNLYFTVALILTIGLLIYTILIPKYVPGFIDANIESRGIEHNIESFIDTIPIPPSGVPYGYYQASSGKMAKIPYGYDLDLSDPTKSKIIPMTNINFYSAKPIPIPSSGLPDGYYQVSPGFMSHLPPGMKAKIVSVDAKGNATYDTGYIPEAEFYDIKLTRPIDDQGVEALPNGYYLAEDGMSLSVLPYGKLPKYDETGSRLEPGYIDNPNLISSTGVFDYGNKKYSDVSNKFDVNYHEDESAIRERQKSFEPPQGGVVVLDKDGNYAVLPRESIQGDITYNEPGSFKYGQSNYVPTYEDSVYLSRTTMLPTQSPFVPTNRPAGFCTYFKNDPEEIERQCNKLDPNACASTTCCVLLGGSKCVRGDQRGPKKMANYSDVFIRNKDFYYYQGKCFGNCANGTLENNKYSTDLVEDIEEDEDTTDTTNESNSTTAMGPSSNSSGGNSDTQIIDDGTTTAEDVNQMSPSTVVEDIEEPIEPSFEDVSASE